MPNEGFFFLDTPNPAPVQGSTALWTTEKHNNNTVTWTSSDDSIVTVRGTGEDNKNAYVTAVGLGVASISARLNDIDDTMIRRDVCVGELFAYTSSGNLRSAPSNEWRVVTTGVSDLPSKREMDENQYGAAYQSLEKRLVLDFTVLLGALGGDTTQSASFTASESSGGVVPAGPAGLPEGLPTYAFAPDGTLWEIGNVHWSPASTSSFPSGFPSKTAMDQDDASLAWAPPGGLPTSTDPAVDVSVTCFVLNQDAFPAPSTSVNNTYYTFRKIGER